MCSFPASISVSARNSESYDLLCSSQTIFTCAQVDDFCHEDIGHLVPSKKNDIAASAAGRHIGFFNRRSIRESERIASSVAVIKVP
jgi:hypothetical protein